jgi:DTW domain-containing protein YfiP
MLPRWCVCDGLREVCCPFAVDVLMHDMEALRPTSTGHLIQRVVRESGQHIFRRERPLDKEAIMRPGKTLWILHPQGEPMPEGGPPEELQVLLLDGTWRQADRMMQGIQSWGRKVSLPMRGRSRYWLRSQQGETQFSTVEALLFLLSAFGLRAQHVGLRLQLELHVYASLCMRGHVALAAEYLAGSPLRGAMPEQVRRLAPRKAFGNRDIGEAANRETETIDTRCFTTDFGLGSRLPSAHCNRDRPNLVNNV